MFGRTDFSVISTAPPLALHPGTLTCERCPLPAAECRDRATAPVLYDRAQRQEHREAALADLMQTVQKERS